MENQNRKIANNTLHQKDYQKSKEYVSRVDGGQEARQYVLDDKSLITKWGQQVHDLTFKYQL